jgi:hypothetical protein
MSILESISKGLYQYVLININRQNVASVLEISTETGGPAIWPETLQIVYINTGPEMLR